MRIVGLKEFMTLGPVLYAEYDSNFYVRGKFNIKWCNSDNIKNDWIMSQIAPDQLDTNSFNDTVDLLDKMDVDSSILASMDFEGTMREGMYYEDDDNIKFAVYERDDIENLIYTLQKVLIAGDE